jgi:hypothetical protein
MQKPQHKSPHRRQKQAFWFDLGRLIFPELISRPRTMQIRMVAISIGLAAILIGSMIGFIRRANDPANILMIQAREAR